jgi:hypothetical protein
VYGQQHCGDKIGFYVVVGIGCLCWQVVCNVIIIGATETRKFINLLRFQDFFLTTNEQKHPLYVHKAVALQGKLTLTFTLLEF